MWEKIKILLIKIKNVLIGTDQDVDTITNIYQAREAYENTSFFSSRKKRKIVAAIWDNFSSIEIDNITAADQARKAYRNSRPSSKIEKLLPPNGTIFLSLKLILLKLLIKSEGLIMILDPAVKPKKLLSLNGTNYH